MLAAEKQTISMCVWKASKIDAALLTMQHGRNSKRLMPWFCHSDETAHWAENPVLGDNSPKPMADSNTRFDNHDRVTSRDCPSLQLIWPWLTAPPIIEELHKLYLSVRTVAVRSAYSHFCTSIRRKPTSVHLAPTDSLNSQLSHTAIAENSFMTNWSYTTYIYRYTVASGKSHPTPLSFFGAWQ